MPKKRVMILGVTGSLGRYLAKTFSDKYDVISPLPRGPGAPAMPQGVRSLRASFDAHHVGSIQTALVEARPDVVVNCIAITPRSPKSSDRLASLWINGIFPQVLAKTARATNTYVIHISTDGVFSGNKGNYVEQDRPDSADLYGSTKLLGEVADDHCLTLRTTFFGMFDTGAGLFNWLLRQNDGAIQGYAHYRFTPLSVARLAKVLEDVIDRRERPFGIYHVGGEPTTKLELLKCVRDEFSLRVEILASDSPVVDRSLNSAKLWHMLAQPTPKIAEMVWALRRELRGDIRTVA